MKTFAILVSIVFCLAVMNVNAQSISNEFTTYTGIGFECDGVYDVAWGDATWHTVIHYNKDGNVDWFKMQVHSEEMVSQSTGEIFTLSYIDKEDGFWALGEVIEVTYHFNLVGDMGTHLIYSMTYEIDTATFTWTLINEKSKCL